MLSASSNQNFDGIKHSISMHIIFNKYIANSVDDKKSLMCRYIKIVGFSQIKLMSREININRFYYWMFSALNCVNTRCAIFSNSCLQLKYYVRFACFIFSITNSSKGSSMRESILRLPQFTGKCVALQGIQINYCIALTQVVAVSMTIKLQTNNFLLRQLLWKLLHAIAQKFANKKCVCNKHFSSIFA